MRKELHNIASAAYNAHVEKTGEIYTCGASDADAFVFAPAMMRLYSAKDLRQFQMIRACNKTKNGTMSCTSAPNEYTKKGWEELGSDLIQKLASNKIDIFGSDDENPCIDVGKIASYLADL